MGYTKYPDDYLEKIDNENQSLEKLYTPLRKVNKLNLPKIKCYVYKITVGGKDFIGFTTENNINDEENRLIS